MFVYETRFDKPATYTHNVNNDFYCQSIAPSINIITPLRKVDWSAFSEACQKSKSARVFIECHWLACADFSLLEIIAQLNDTYM